MENGPAGEGPNVPPVALADRYNRLPVVPKPKITEEK